MLQKINGSRKIWEGKTLLRIKEAHQTDEVLRKMVESHGKWQNIKKKQQMKWIKWQSVGTKLHWFKDYDRVVEIHAVCKYQHII